MNSIETRAGVLIMTHRTPAPERELLAAFYPYWVECNANECLEITFKIKPIYFPGDVNEPIKPDGLPE